MAVLTEQQRDDVWAKLMKTWSRRREPVAIGKGDGRAAVGATDDYQEANKVTYNAALPAVVQSGLTATQKAEMFAAIAAIKWEVG